MGTGRHPPRGLPRGSLSPQPGDNRAPHRPQVGVHIGSRRSSVSTSSQGWRRLHRTGASAHCSREAEGHCIQHPGLLTSPNPLYARDMAQKGAQRHAWAELAGWQAGSRGSAARPLRSRPLRSPCPRAIPPPSGPETKSKVEVPSGAFGPAGCLPGALGNRAAGKGTGGTPGTPKCSSGSSPEQRGQPQGLQPALHCVLATGGAEPGAGPGLSHGDGAAAPHVPGPPPMYGSQGPCTARPHASSPSRPVHCLPSTLVPAAAQGTGWPPHPAPQLSALAPFFLSFYFLGKKGGLSSLKVPLAGRRRPKPGPPAGLGGGAAACPRPACPEGSLPSSCGSSPGPPG